MKNNSFSIFLKQALASCSVLLCMAFLSGCAEDYQPKAPPSPKDYVPLYQIQIKQRFETVSLTRGNLLDEIRKCITTGPTVGKVSREDLLEKFPSELVHVIYHVSTSRRFAYRKQTGLCVEYSANKYPIFAVETFLRTANPVGVPEAISNNWYMQIAREMAIQGQVKVLYARGENQAASLVSYWHEPGESVRLNYSSEFKQAGQWENIPVDFKFFSPTFSGISKTSWGGMDKKFFPLADN